MRTLTAAHAFRWTIGFAFLCLLSSCSLPQSKSKRAGASRGCHPSLPPVSTSLPYRRQGGYLRLLPVSLPYRLLLLPCCPTNRTLPHCTTPASFYLLRGGWMDGHDWRVDVHRCTEDVLVARLRGKFSVSPMRRAAHGDADRWMDGWMSGAAGEAGARDGRTAASSTGVLTVSDFLAEARMYAVLSH
ncbi:uncharacterized protein J3D65DRAFT_376916 [Phyllosticta citribraziliensis]|uniref:Uncharacterized protein n=1 Tax=Phyllosticta citribraziliensis TaxID=989973 RepID=A0ABR1LQ73_9PEZI